MTLRSLAVLLLAVVVVGCAPPRKSRKKVEGDAPPAATPPPPAVVADESDKAGATAAAEAFLKKVVAADPKDADLEAAAGSLTAAAKKRMSGALVFEADKKAGFALGDVTKKLRTAFGGFTGWSVKKTAFGGRPGDLLAAARGELTGPKDARAVFALRLAKSGGGWMIDGVGRPAGTAAEAPAELAWAAEVGQQFLDAACAGDHKAAAAVMAADTRARIAPPTTDADKQLGYDDFRLGNWLKDRLAGATAYTANAATAAGGGAALAGELTGGPKPVPFALTLARDGAGWAVTGFEAKKGGGP